MSPLLRVFVDARGVDVPQGATVLDAIRAHDAEQARAVERGARAVTDSRGLPVDPSAPTYAGAIYRIGAARARGAGESSHA